MVFYTQLPTYNLVILLSKVEITWVLCHLVFIDLTKGLKSRFILKFKTLVLNFVQSLLNLGSISQKDLAQT